MRARGRVKRPGHPGVAWGGLDLVAKRGIPEDMKPLSQPVTPEDHLFGRPDATLVIVEYGDYDCPHTRAAHANLMQIAAERDGDLRLVYRHFPLRHLHPLADWLAEHTELAQLQDRFWPLHELLMREHHMLRPVAERAMAAVGLDLAPLPAHLEAIRARVQADVERGMADGVHSTPSFFLNGHPHDGHYDVETLRAQIRLALAA